MNTSLTTFDGYPRDDIDVAQSSRSLQALVNHLLTYDKSEQPEQE